MKYCSNCSQPVVFKEVEGDSHLRFVCDECETIHYQNPRIIVGCLPVWEDKVLLASRAIEPRSGFWNVPGGFMENGETMKEGAAREVMEETFANVKVTRLFTTFAIPKINQVHIHFLGELQNLDFKPGIESIEVKLFLKSEIPWDDIAFHSSKFTLENYFAMRNTEIQEVFSSFI